MDGNISALYDIIIKRKIEGGEGSYTNYLFEKGTNKILKKVGEECTEVIISCKEDNKEEQINEICDLTYHLLVLMAQMNISVEEVSAELEKRRNKINNFKGERKPITEV
ncbi:MULTISPECIES: phosphoribosyl-ATP diphosphatase [unclassified Clostridium]|uniref:phosphoribosyl-ATP diphosphatase n=1 Tax=unclassified Clostridium TaxID=2614128 RepID=UPI0002979381|nr:MULTISPECIES: phosphoribosyl-ATP diphosphatase [unclassified Clostridium]EKQ53308.1 MAG: phosphoribosyl-ATP pyrophosphohydrolase [Clostridium sp. Maddingley MBC34-26]